MLLIQLTPHLQHDKEACVNDDMPLSVRLACVFHYCDFRSTTSLLLLISIITVMLLSTSLIKQCRNRSVPYMPSRSLVSMYHTPMRLKVKDLRFYVVTLA